MSRSPVNIMFARKSLFYMLVVILLVSYSCRTTKYVPENKYLLEKYELKGEGKKINREELSSYVKQKPNKKIIGLKFHLAVYSLSKKDKDNWWNRMLRTIGEEPVIYDEFQTGKTVDQLELYLRSKGYYNAVVTDSVIYDRKNDKKVSVKYYIEKNDPYILRKIRYSFEDTTLRSLVLSDTANSMLHAGEHFDVDILSHERERIEVLLKNHGYYYFSKEFIYYEADTSLTDHKVDLTLIVKKYRIYNENGTYVEMPHPQFRIRHVYINTNYNPREALANNTNYLTELDTISLDSTYIVYQEKPNVHPNVVIESNYILPGDLYNLNNYQRSYRNLSSLKIFRLVTIDYSQVGDIGPDNMGELDCNIMLTPQTLQSYTVELEGTNSSGNIGAAGNIIYQHRNLFKGAENFDLRLKGALETLKENYSSNLGNMIEFGAELRYSIPKFLLPFKTDQFIKKYNPRTSFSMAYNYQQRPEYTRTLANASFGYNWRGNRYLTHIINPIELNLVKIPYKSPEFVDWLEGKYIYYSYQPHLVTVTSYSLIFNNQNIQKNRDFMYFRMNVEQAGNLLYSLYKTAGIQENNQGSFTLFNNEFSQYVRGDIDFRYYNVFDENTSLVYRIFAGAGLPYKNSTALPFEKKYFAGGANGIRAWQVRNLGPGSYNEKQQTLYPNQTADIKLEGNIEYRFKLFWLIDG
ncbi:MAG TPA: BamA/TamA family outer membrane protein, partial [Bacteroidales bacterium]|nr:BamA/TamA family outer membrane protein [Bacteroidales bacterium]